MFAPKRIVALSMVVLASAAAGAISYALSHRAALFAADKPAPDVERAKQQWQELEQRHAEEMVKARMEAADLEDQLRIRDQEWSAVRADLSLVRKNIESTLAKLAQPRVPQHLQGEEKELSAKEEKLRADMRKARQKFFLAEERMWQLAREQARQRDRSRARSDATGEKRNAEQETSLQRRLQETEHGLDRLRRQLAQAPRPAPPQPPIPPPMIPGRNSPFPRPVR